MSALARQLKDSLAHRRPRPWKLVLATLAGSVLMLVLLAWWLYPGPKPALLQIIALDVVCPPDETPHARAQLFAPPEDKEQRRLRGYTVVFHEPPLLLAPDVHRREVVAKTDERGQASVEWPVDGAHTEYKVRHIDVEQRRGSRDDGRIFVWPKKAPLLIVDADETLIADTLDEQAPKTLTKAANDGWHIVYLSLTSAQPLEFRKARGWIEEPSKLPKGPGARTQTFLRRRNHRASPSRCAQTIARPIPRGDARRGQERGIGTSLPGGRHARNRGRRRGGAGASARAHLGGRAAQIEVTIHAKSGCTRLWGRPTRASSASAAM